MSENNEEIKVTRKEPGYSHTKIWGTCPEGTSVKQIKERFFDSYLGGRDARVSGTNFYCIRHDD